MSTLVLAFVVTVLCLVILPELLYSSRRFDANPRAGLTIWFAICAIGWFSAIVLFLQIGLQQFQGALLPTTISFLERLGDGHPLRGLGLSEVVGLSVAFDITVLLIGGMVTATWKIWHLRQSQRVVLDLVARTADIADVSILQHPQPLAYYLPGDGGRVVVSSGAIEILSRVELDAVLSHEQGHRHGHHGALLIPLQALTPFVTFLPIARYAPSVIHTYLEMAADDFARQRTATEALHQALEKSNLFHHAPQGAFSMYDDVIERRLRRLGMRAMPFIDQSILLLTVGGACSLAWTLLMLRQ